MAPKSLTKLNRERHKQYVIQHAPKTTNSAGIVLHHCCAQHIYSIYYHVITRNCHISRAQLRGDTRDGNGILAPKKSVLPSNSTLKTTNAVSEMGNC